MLERFTGVSLELIMGVGSSSTTNTAQSLLNIPRADIQNYIDNGYTISAKKINSTTLGVGYSDAAGATDFTHPNITITMITATITFQDITSQIATALNNGVNFPAIGFVATRTSGSVNTSRIKFEKS